MRIGFLIPFAVHKVTHMSGEAELKLVGQIGSCLPIDQARTIPLVMVIIELLLNDFVFQK